MTKAVLDSTVLVSAFLSRAGISRQLLQRAGNGDFALYLADEILAETRRVLLTYKRIRTRYPYTDEDVDKYIELIRAVAQVVTALPSLQVVARDPNDDMIIACAVAAKAQHIITRDKDLLDLESYAKIEIVSPEEYMKVLRQNS